MPNMPSRRGSSQDLVECPPIIHAIVTGTSIQLVRPPAVYAVLASASVGCVHVRIYKHAIWLEEAISALAQRPSPVIAVVMRRSGKAPSRPGSSRSDKLPVYLTLVSTKDTFLNTLLVNRATGVPLYATVTKAECTTLYAIDRTMELHRIVAVNWDQGGKPSRTTLTNRANETLLLSEVWTTSQSQKDLISLLEEKKATDINYSYGRFASRWTQGHRASEPWFNMGFFDIVCHRKQLVADSFQSPETSPSASSSPPLVSEQPFATMTLHNIPGNPWIKIGLHIRDSLQRVAHEDRLTDLDHVVIGALLTCSHAGRKRGRGEPDGWLNEAQLREHLRAKHQINRTQSIDTLPAYRARQSGETLPPAYGSRTSLRAGGST
ncbi:hypothetical protein ACGC1H_006999 [Rhizoctonia solani]